MVTRDEIVAIARDRGIVFHPRNIRYWESLGKIPKCVVRRQNGAPRALYPPEVVDQVIRVALQGRGKAMTCPHCGAPIVEP